MIPVMIITEDNTSFNYFNKDIYAVNFKEDAEGKRFVIQYRGTRLNSVAYKTDSEPLRNKVLELLHKEVAKCGYERVETVVIPACFQIYLKDIIEKARKELK